MIKYLFTLLFLFVFNILTAQQYDDFGFARNFSVPVLDSALNIIPNPWGGGLNSCQFSEIDLNFDGTKDLFVYDRSSAKVMTYINNGTTGTVDYSYAPEYIQDFPEIRYWAQLIDYNNDGKEDLYTYSGAGGISVYKNISNSTDGIKFIQVADILSSLQGTQYSPILSTPVDFPAISDIDGDGDYDILNFWGLGEYVQFHKNMSMELYGNADSLIFERQDFCWGNFAESAYGNTISLNINCPGKYPEVKDTNAIEHTGSTLLALDLNGDNVKDLLVGDVDYPGIIALHNGGTTTDAIMVSKDTLFPSNTTTINLVSFPATCYLDVNNDGKKDLMVSPFDANIAIAENKKSCWYYNNTGTTESPVFEFVENNFLQKDMIDLGTGAYPVLYDYDGDGLKDLFIANFGAHDSSYYSSGYLYSVFISGISLYKNTGTASNPEFTFVTDDFAGIRSRKLTGVYPTFGDIDGDGAAEMIIGKSNGKLDLYENLAPAGQPMDMILSQVDYENIYVGNTPTQTYPSATPQIFDLDKDSLLDLIIGEKSGTINFYKNTGTTQTPYFTQISDSLGKVDVVKHSISNYGFSTPCFFTDHDGSTKLFVGSESGYIYYYKNIDGNLSGTFTLEDSMYLYIYDGMHSAVAIANLDNDNYADMITGNYSGGLTYYKGVAPHPVEISNLQNNNSNVEIYPNPAINIITAELPYGSTGNLYITIFDSQGAMILNAKKSIQNRNITFDVSSLSNGIYFMNFYSDKGISLSAKFLICR